MCCRVKSNKDRAITAFAYLECLCVNDLFSSSFAIIVFTFCLTRVRFFSLLNLVSIEIISIQKKKRCGWFMNVWIDISLSLMFIESRFMVWPKYTAINKNVKNGSFMNCCTPLAHSCPLNQSQLSKFYCNILLTQYFLLSFSLSLFITEIWHVAAQ